jgi:hypothetical protein
MFQPSDLTNGDRCFIVWMALVWERLLTEALSPPTIATFTDMHMMHVCQFVKRMPIRTTITQYKKEFHTTLCSSSCTVCDCTRRIHTTNTSQLLKVNYNDAKNMAEGHI